MTVNNMEFNIMLMLFLTIGHAVIGQDYVIDDTAGLGRRFDGIGGLSGGGATSKLLVNYPEPERSQILDYLFKPNFGASLHILKVEIGGDSQSTDGTESSHMHEADDENYERGYEWWLMVEAKKRNPAIKLYGLPWAFPGWVGEGTESPYVNPQKTADYVLKWIQGAKKHYNLTIDYVGSWNERPYNMTYIKVLRKTLDDHDLGHIQTVVADGSWKVANDVIKHQAFADAVDVIGWNERPYNMTYIETLRHTLDVNGLHNVQTVVADKHWEVVNDVLKHKEFAKAVNIIGAHQCDTFSTPAARHTNKTLWSSEDWTTHNNNTGGACLARILNMNYVIGHLQTTICWNLVAAYYSDLPYGLHGLMTAKEPWSGHYSVESPIWMAAHTTQFTKPGWTYYAHGSGVGNLTKGGSYVSFLCPMKKDLTIVIQTMTFQHSKCFNRALTNYTIEPQTATFQLEGAVRGVPKLFMWYSRLGFDGDETILFQQKDPIQVVDGKFSVEMGLDEVVSLTTISSGNKGHYPSSPPSAPFPLPYKDDFEGYTEGQEAFNFVPQIGVYEVHDSADAAHGKVNTQVIRHHPVDWCQGDGVIKNYDLTINVGGNFNWTDVTIQSDIMLPGGPDSANGSFLGLRVPVVMNHGGCKLGNTAGVYLTLYPDTSEMTLTTDMLRLDVIMSISHNVNYGEWFNLKLELKGKIATAYLNHEELLQQEMTSLPDRGFTAYGTSSFGLAHFDNLLIEPPQRRFTEVRGDLGSSRVHL